MLKSLHKLLLINKKLVEFANLRGTIQLNDINR